MNYSHFPCIHIFFISFRYRNRDRREEVCLLLQGTELLPSREVAPEPLPPAIEKAAEPAQHGHEEMELKEPENVAGKAKLGHSKRVLPQPSATATAATSTTKTSVETTEELHRSDKSMWYQRRIALEDQERLARGEPAIKRYRRTKAFYACKKCGQPKNKETGHTQISGNWFCPHDPESGDYADWKAMILARKKQQ